MKYYLYHKYYHKVQGFKIDCMIWVFKFSVEFYCVSGLIFLSPGLSFTHKSLENQKHGGRAVGIFCFLG